MRLFSRFPILFWFLIIALLTSASVSFYSYQNVFHKQIEETKKSELGRVNQRMLQLQGTVNDFNRRHDFNAIHREVSRLSSDPTMDLIVIIDEHGIIKTSSLIEYRNTPVSKIPDIQQVIKNRGQENNIGFIRIQQKKLFIIGLYPLDHISNKTENDIYNNSYLFAKFELSHTLDVLRYRQQQEIIQIMLIHFAILLGGFLLLYAGMRSRIKLIMHGINSFSNGNYDSRIQLSGVDEFSKISNGFDSMAARLQSQNKDMIDLTKQLTKQHKELAQQEQDLRVTLNSIGDAVITTNPDGKITRMNPVAQTLTGWPLDEAIGQSITCIFKIINAQTKQVIENPIDKVIKSGQTIYLNNNTTLISRDGTEYNISDSAAPIRNEDNKILGMVLIFNDITEQYRLREAKNESDERFRQLAENIDDVFWLGSADWNEVFYISPAYEKKWGKNIEDLYKNPQLWLDAIHPDDRKQVIDDIPTDVNNIGEVVDFREYRILKPDNQIRWIKARAYPILDSNGQVIRMAGIAEDITIRKQQEQHLRQSQKMDALGKLTGGIAHDFNNLLGIIMGYSEMLKSHYPKDSKSQKYASEIHHAGTRGASLTRKLLSFSRPQKAENETLNINSLLLDRKEMLEKVLTARIKLSLNLDEHLWPVLINSGDFEDAIVNICINAMHAMESHGELTIRTSNESLNALEANRLQIDIGEYIKISFIDTGTGMDKETQDKMFDPFFSSKGDLGCGLGLSQVYGLVQSSDGGINVESELGQGSCISIYFPRHVTRNTVAVFEPIESLEIMTGKAVILVVDDEPSLRELTKEIFILNGYDVVTAENGKIALDILKSQSVDILFSDIIMPEMDGYELASITQQVYPDIKILLVSGYNDNIDSEFSNNELYKNLLHKPYSADEILKRIKEMLS